MASLSQDAVKQKTVWQKDLSAYRFSDRMIESNNSNVSRPYVAVSDLIDKGFLSTEFQATGYFPKSAYRECRSILDSVVRQYPSDSGIVFVQRRLVLLDWYVGKVDFKSVRIRLEDLAERHQKHRQTTRAMAALVSLRCGEIREATILLSKLEPLEVSNFSWYLIAFVNRWGEYVAEALHDTNGKVSSQPNPEHLRRILSYGRFVHDIFSPMLRTYLSEGNEERPAWEQANNVLACETTAEDTLRLVPFFQFEFSEKCTDELLPEVLKVWESALRQMGPITNTLLDKEKSLRRLRMYREKAIPKVRQMRENLVFKIEMSPDLSDPEDPVSSVDSSLSEKSWPQYVDKIGEGVPLSTGGVDDVGKEDDGGEGLDSVINNVALGDDPVVPPVPLEDWESHIWLLCAGSSAISIFFLWLVHRWRHGTETRQKGGPNRG